MALGLPLSKELEFISSELDKLRFMGTDQNPKGIRDLLYCCISDAKKLEQKVLNETQGNLFEDRENKNG